MILLIIESPKFNCKLKLPEKSAGRLTKSIINYHKEKYNSFFEEKPFGEYIKVEFRHI